MPAIQLDRLRQETAVLGAYYYEPQHFVSQLNELLEFYADRTRRVRRAGMPAPLLPSYKVPPAFLRQTLASLSNLIVEDPKHAILVADVLWRQPMLEHRQLAIRILGLTPAEGNVPAILDRVNTWNLGNEEESLQEDLARYALDQIAQADWELFEWTITEWLGSDRVREIKLGLFALKAYLTTARFENLPPLFRLLTPLVITTTRKIRPYVLDLIGLLAQRSPLETGYFLRQCLKEGENSASAVWFVRHSLEYFDADQQAGLKEAIKPAKPTENEN